MVFALQVLCPRSRPRQRQDLSEKSLAFINANKLQSDLGAHSQDTPCEACRQYSFSTILVFALMALITAAIVKAHKLPIAT